MKKRVIIILSAVAVASAFAATQASAATEFGSGCTATGIADGLTTISVSHGAASPLPVTAPISGVLTEWTVNMDLAEEHSPLEEEDFVFDMQPHLGLFTPAGGNSYTLTAEAPSGPFNLHGTTHFQTRIPVQAGELIGLIGVGPAATASIPVCAPSDRAEAFAYNFSSRPQIGTPSAFSRPLGGNQVPVTARIEPDVDGDGFGDETQDGCPQSALYQTACPVVTISSRPVARKQAVTLFVGTSLSAPVGVSAIVNLGKGKKATLTATTQTVTPGMLAPFQLAFPKSVTKALAKLPAKKSLPMSITASATNLTGAPSVTTSTIKLHGQAKAVHKPR